MVFVSLRLGLLVLTATAVTILLAAPSTITILAALAATTWCGVWCVVLVLVLVLVADRIIKLLEFYINCKVCIVFSDTAVLALIILYIPI